VSKGLIKAKKGNPAIYKIFVLISMEKVFMRITLLLIFSIFMASSCIPALPKPIQVPLVHSSTDFNKGALHKIQVKGVDMGVVITKLNELAEKRDLLIVNKSCEELSCDLVYKKKDHALSKTIGSGVVSTGSQGKTYGSSSVSTTNMTFSSRIFATLQKNEDHIKIKMIGVPVINGTLSCPEILEKRKECEAQMFNVYKNQTPAQSFKGIWGVDISGNLELEIIQGIFAEL